MRHDKLANLHGTRRHVVVARERSINVVAADVVRRRTQIAAQDLL